MLYLYQAGIWLYFFLARLISVFSPRAKEFVNSRERQYKQGFANRDEGQNLIWFHASSLGEYEQGLPLVKEWKKARPDWQILITFFSSSGFEQKAESSPADMVDYLPRDTRGAARDFLDHYKPGLAVFIKYDIWPVLLDELKKRDIPSYLVSAVFRRKQIFFRWFGVWYLNVLRNFSMIFTQDELSLNLLAERGFESVKAGGDTRIDRVIELARDETGIKAISEYSEGYKILIAGSSWPAEEKMLAGYLNQNENPDFKVIIAPHDVSERHIDSIIQLFGKSALTYSDLLENYGRATGKRVLVIDRIGLLSRLYRYGDIAFIGGAFGRGLHNILEPAVYGLPVVFGPEYHKFLEAVELVDSGAAFPVKNISAFQSIINGLLSDEDSYIRASKGCKTFVKSRSGSTSLIISHLLEND